MLLFENKPSTLFNSTKFHLGSTLLTKEKIAPFLTKGRTVIVADEAVKELYGEPLAKQLGADLISLPGGELTKTKERADFLIDALLQRGVGKDGTLIALGGGVMSDLVGFVASIYMRGISLILIPTTLLAMVDASIGGKTGVDTPYGKNLLGTFYPPKAVFADLDTLKTLPEKERFNGLAEIWKIGLVYDPLIWKEGEMIPQAIQAKISIVEQDPTDKGLRKILNFGHTIGHALEAVANYTIPHGQAVALGCLVESYLSVRLGYLSEEDFSSVEARYTPFPLQLPKEYTRPKFLEALLRDKKNLAGKIRFVLIDRIGNAIPFEGDYCRAVSLDELEDTFNWMERRC